MAGGKLGLVVVIVGCVVVTVVPVTATRAASETAVGPCDESSWVAGTSEWCRGWFVHRDLVYDDTGADSGGTPVYPSAEGDVDHRQHGQSLNSADLRVLRLRIAGSKVEARFELNTLFPGDTTIAYLAVDTDGDASTGGGPWGVGNVTSAGWDELLRFDERDPDDNVVSGTATLRTRPSRAIRVQAMVALGDGTPMNVAFRTGEAGYWWEAAQASALATGDISAWGAEIDTTDFGAAHRPAPPTGEGLHARVYRSGYPLGEGFEPYQGTTSMFHALGAYQPYTVYVPEDPGPHPVQLILHGLGVGHGTFTPGVTADFGDDTSTILVGPLGRGTEGWWLEWAARDAFDSLADVEAHYDTDPEAVYLSGYSMGGLGTMQLSTMFPDRWAATFNGVGSTGDCANGTPVAQGHQRPDGLDTVAPYDGSGQLANDPSRRSGCPGQNRVNAFDLLENLRHVPSSHSFGLFDLGAFANTTVPMQEQLEQLGFEYIVWHQAADHSLFVQYYDLWRKEAQWLRGRRIVRHPAHITYRTNTFSWQPAVDLVPDGAYWVDGMKPRNAATTPDGDMAVDLVSHACDPSTETTSEVRRDAGTDPVPWVSQAGIPNGVETVEPGALITGTATNLAELTIDVAGACFDHREPFDVDIAVDGPTIVHFSDGRPPLVLGEPAPPAEPEEPIDAGLPATSVTTGINCLAGNTTAGDAGIASSCSFTIATTGTETLYGYDGGTSGSFTISTDQPGCSIGLPGAPANPRSTNVRGAGYSLVELDFDLGCTYMLAVNPDGVGVVLAGQLS